MGLMTNWDSERPPFGAHSEGLEVTRKENVWPIEGNSDSGVPHTTSLFPLPSSQAPHQLFQIPRMQRSSSYALISAIPVPTALTHHLANFSFQSPPLLTSSADSSQSQDLFEINQIPSLTLSWSLCLSLSLSLPLFLSLPLSLIVVVQIYASSLPK